MNKTMFFRYIQNFKDTLVRISTSLGHTILMAIFASPFMTFIYLKATMEAPKLMEDGTRTDIGKWGDLSFNYVSLEWFAIFSSVAFLGALGSTVSFVSRHSPDQGQVKRQQTLIGTQMLGAVFATVLLFTFTGGLVQGSLFPSIAADSWTDLNLRIPDWSKLLVWSFIAGFSERFVPDLLDNLIRSGNKSGGTALQQASSDKNSSPNS